jgi:hypothetical protein
MTAPNPGSAGTHHTTTEKRARAKRASSPPPPTGNRRWAVFSHARAAGSYGQRGIEQGHWSDYHCEGRVQGLDYCYDLYIPPGE